MVKGEMSQQTIIWGVRSKWSDPPLVNRITHKTENGTFPRTSYVVGNDPTPVRLLQWLYIEVPVFWYIILRKLNIHVLQYSVAVYHTVRHRSVCMLTVRTLQWAVEDGDGDDSIVW